MTASDYKTLDIQYLECCRKYRVDFNEDSFNASKLIMMQKRLALRKQSIKDVENLMNWPLQPRDAAGFFNTGALRFPSNEKLYSEISGISVNVTTGFFDFLLEPAGADNALFTEREVQFITENNIFDCSFSLDPENLSLAPQPFQQMSFSPENLEDTDFLKTLLMSDYLLKCLINGINVSSQAPFLKKPIASLLAKMSPELEKALVSPRLRREKDSIAQVSSRCWIECEPVASAYEQDEKTHIVFFDKTKCTVKTQLFRPASKEEKSDGKSEDYVLRHNLVEFKGNGSTGEEQFAEAMTAVFDELAEFLPVFKRLKELTKLCAANKILSSIGKSLAESLKVPYNVKCTSSVGKWASHLKSSCVLVPSTLVLDYYSPASSEKKPDLKVGDRIDAQDVFCFWFTTEVVRETETRVLIRYDGWGDEWDEWFSKNSSRLQPVHTYTPTGQRSTGRGSGVLRLPATGTAILALCSDKRYREAKVIDAKDQSVRVEFPDKTTYWCTEFQFRLFDDFEPVSAESFSLQKFNVGQDVDAVDIAYRCYTGTIVQKSATGNVKVHFDGWSSEFDEWIPAGMIKSRLFPLHTYTEPKMRTVAPGSGIPNGSVAVMPPIEDKIIFVKDGKAFLGTVEQASPCGKKFLVKYQGSISEWVSVDEGRVQRAEVVMNPALAENVANGKFYEGDDIDARDSCFGWFTATVTAVDEIRGRISVHWHGWPTSHDEWIRIGTSRLAPLHTHTKNKSPPKSLGVPVAPDIGAKVNLNVDGIEISGEVVAKLSTTTVSVKCVDGVQRNADVSKYGSVTDDIIVELAFSDLTNYIYGGIKLNVTSSLMKSGNEPLKTKPKETKEKGFNIHTKAASLGLCLLRKNIFTCIGEVGSAIAVGNAVEEPSLLSGSMVAAGTLGARVLKASPVSLLVGTGVELSSQVVLKDLDRVCLEDFNDEYNENRPLISKLRELVTCATYTVLGNLHVIDNSCKLTKEELEAALAQEKALQQKN